NEGLTTWCPLKAFQYRILCIGFSFIFKIHTGIQANVNPASKDDQCNMRCLSCAFTARNRTRFNGIETPKTSFEVCACTSPTEEVWIDRFALNIRRTWIHAVGIRLPDFNQYIT